MSFQISKYIDEQLALNRNRDPSFRRYRSTLFPKLTDATGGFNAGLYVVVSDPNIGKSCFLQTLAYDLLVNNSHPRVLFYTFDDSAEEMTKRFIATATFNVAGVEKATAINNAFYGRGNNNTDDHMKAIMQFQEFHRADRFYMKDLMRISTTKQITADIQKEVAKNPNDTIVFIDSSLTLTASGSSFEEDKNRAIDLKKLVAITGAPVFITAEKKKDNEDSGVKRVDMRDISGHAKMAFCANFVLSFSYEDKDKFFSKEGERWNMVKGYISKNKVGDLRGSFPFESFGKFATIIEEDRYSF